MVKNSYYDWTINYRLWEHRKMIMHSTYLQARNKIFHLDVSNQCLQANKWWSSLEVSLEIWIIRLTMFGKISQSHIQDYNLMLTSTILYSSVAIDVDSWCVVITQLSWSCCRLRKSDKPWIQLPSYS